MSEAAAVVYVSILTLALCSGLTGFALTTRKFGEAFLWATASTICAVSIIGAIQP